MSGSGQTIKNSADPLNILGGSGSSVGGNVIDPGNVFHMDNSGFQNNGNVFNGSGVAPAQLPPGYSGIPTLPSNLSVPTLQGYMLGTRGGQGTIPGYTSNPGMSFIGGQGGLLNAQMPNGPSGTPNYNPGGGYMPAPIGGYWNQVAQQMAGPMFGPQGSSVTLGAQNPVMPQQQSNMTVPQQVAQPQPTASPMTQPSTPVSYTPNPLSGTYALQRHLSMLGGGGPLNGLQLGRTFMK